MAVAPIIPRSPLHHCPEPYDQLIMDPTQMHHIGPTPSLPVQHTWSQLMELVYSSVTQPDAMLLGPVGFFCVRCLSRINAEGQLSYTGQVEGAQRA